MASMTAAPKLERLYSDAFWTALASLHTHGVSDAHAGLAQRLWAKLALAEPSEPDISVEEGVKFSWFGRYYLEVEVMAEGGVTWYFRNTTLPDGESEGDVEAPVAHLPARFWECLALAGACRGPIA